MAFLPKWVQDLVPIAGLLLAIAIVLRRLPRVDLGHSPGFRRRRTWNWLPLGLTYAFLYMGRYNIDVAKNAGLMDKATLGHVSAIGMLVYAVACLINGSLTDRVGGRVSILVAAVGAGLANLVMGLVVATCWHVRGEPLPHAFAIFGVLYGLNMYFQSFGAMSILKVNARWFHVKERGVFGGVFGILISLGIYFAYDWGRQIQAALPLEFLFFVPAAILACFALIDYRLICDRPSDTGHLDFDVGDASSSDDGPRLSALAVFGKMLRNPVIMTIAGIEMVSGVVRGSIMKWPYIFLKETHQSGSFIYHNWGAMLCCAGILGGVVAGIVSDRLFQSRRGPSVTILYAVAICGLLGAAMLQTTPMVGWIYVMVIMSVIGVHGMLSGTASMDFGGARNVGVAAGLIDGMVYLGNAIQSETFGDLLPKKASAPSTWTVVPLICAGVSLLAFLLCLRIWHAHPSRQRAAGAVAPSAPDAASTVS